MQENRNIAVITSPSSVKDEASILREILEAGAHHVLIRKTQEDADCAWRLFDELSEYSERLAMHHTHGVRDGVAMHVPFGLQGVSTSCHSMDEAHEAEEEYPRYYLSPVFDSISKPGYSANPLLTGNPSPRVSTRGSGDSMLRSAFALGGVHLEVLPQLQERGFHSIALHGALWQRESPVEEFNRICKAWRS